MSGEWEIPAPPPERSDEPDTETSKDPCFSDGHAPGQVFHFNFERFGISISYGTDDKGHAAAIILSFTILIIMIILAFIGSSLPDESWMVDILKMLGSAFLLTSGIAVGKTINK